MKRTDFFHTPDSKKVAHTTPEIRLENKRRIQLTLLANQARQARNENIKAFLIELNKRVLNKTDLIKILYTLSSHGCETLDLEAKHVPLIIDCYLQNQLNLDYLSSIIESEVLLDQTSIKQIPKSVGDEVTEENLDLAFKHYNDQQQKKLKQDLDNTFQERLDLREFTTDLEETVSEAAYQSINRLLADDSFNDIKFHRNLVPLIITLFNANLLNAINIKKCLATNDASHLEMLIAVAPFICETLSIAPPCHITQSQLDDLTNNATLRTELLSDPFWSNFCYEHKFRQFEYTIKADPITFFNKVFSTTPGNKEWRDALIASIAEKTSHQLKL